MQVIEYDPSFPPSEWAIGESYLFIRNLSDSYNKDLDFSDNDTKPGGDGGIKPKPGGDGGIKVKPGGGPDGISGGIKVKTDKKTKKSEETTPNNEGGIALNKESDAEGGISKKEDSTKESNMIDSTTGEEGGITIKTKGALSSKGAIDVESIPGKPTGIKYARFIKQIGKVVYKEPKSNGSVWLFVEFETSNGTIGRKYLCPMDPSMYYTMDKWITNAGKEIEL